MAVLYCHLSLVFFYFQWFAERSTVCKWFCLILLNVWTESTADFFLQDTLSETRTNLVVCTMYVPVLVFSVHSPPPLLAISRIGPVLGPVAGFFLLNLSSSCHCCICVGHAVHFWVSSSERKTCCRS